MNRYQIRSACLLLLALFLFLSSCGGAKSQLLSSGNPYDDAARGASAVVIQPPPPAPGPSDCIAGDARYSANVTGGQEMSLKNASGPASGPVVTEPNTAL